MLGLDAATSPEQTIRRYVEATSDADGDTAAALTTDDVVIELPGGAVLHGHEGARQFAAKHAEIDGNRQAVTLSAIDAVAPGRYVLTLVMSSREVVSGELLYSMDVGSVIEVDDGLVTRHHVFPSPQEAAVAAQAD